MRLEVGQLLLTLGEGFREAALFFFEFSRCNRRFFILLFDREEACDLGVLSFDFFF